MSSHREAPGIAKDPVADNTDLYAFVSPDDPNTVTILANFIPLEYPPAGPNFFEFGDDVTYAIHISNDGKPDPDITYRFQFRTTLENHKTFLYNTGPIGSLDDPNWNRRQLYSVAKIIKGSGRTELGSRPRCPPCNVGSAVDARLRVARRATPCTRWTAARWCSRGSATRGSTSTSDRSSTWATCVRSRTCT